MKGEMRLIMDINYLCWPLKPSIPFHDFEQPHDFSEGHPSPFTVIFLTRFSHGRSGCYGRAIGAIGADGCLSRRPQVTPKHELDVPGLIERGRDVEDVRGWRVCVQDEVYGPPAEAQGRDSQHRHCVASLP